MKFPKSTAGKPGLAQVAQVGDFAQTVRMTGNASRMAQRYHDGTRQEILSHFANAWAFAKRQGGFLVFDRSLYFDTLLRTREERPVYACVTWDDQEGSKRPLALLALVADDSWDYRVASRKPMRLTLPAATCPSVEEVAAITARRVRCGHLVGRNIQRFPLGPLTDCCHQAAPNSPLLALLIEAGKVAALRDDALAFLCEAIPRAFNEGRLDAAWACAIGGVNIADLEHLATLPCDDPGIVRDLTMAQMTARRFVALMGHEGLHDGEVCALFQADRARYYRVFLTLCRETIRAFHAAVAALRRGDTALALTYHIADDFRAQWLLPFSFRDGSRGAFVIKRDPATGALTIPTLLPERLAERDACFAGSVIRWARA